jgi:hypothetical protein
VISLLAARASRDLIVAGHQRITEDFWARHLQRYELRVSRFVWDEIVRGDSRAAQRRADFVRDIPVLAFDDRVGALAELLVRRSAIAEQARLDATHVAIAAVHDVDYLLTWNLKHIAHAIVRRRIEAACRDAGYEVPVLCTP